MDAALQALAFPPTLVMTLVENAIRHGIEPAGGGCVLVRAACTDATLQVDVIDDGLGFGGAPSSGTGVGLVNVRRQLAALHGDNARLTLTANEPRGARARITIRLPAIHDAPPA
jgi:LytS/YehU family sensor histidine kinase